jgi:hypothetical protein
LIYSRSFNGEFFLIRTFKYLSNPYVIKIWSLKIIDNNDNNKIKSNRKLNETSIEIPNKKSNLLCSEFDKQEILFYLKT